MSRLNEPVWRQAPDGTWHPFQMAPQGYEKRKSPAWVSWLAIVIVFAVVGAGVFIAVYKIRTRGPQTVSSNIPGLNEPISVLNQSVQAQLVRSTDSSGFGVTGLSTVTCNPPASWAPSKTFACFAFDASKHAIGEYDATITPSSADGIGQWVGRWIPAQ